MRAVELGEWSAASVESPGVLFPAPHKTRLCGTASLGCVMKLSQKRERRRREEISNSKVAMKESALLAFQISY